MKLSEESKLLRRTILSFTVLILFFLGAWWGFNYIKKGPASGYAPVALRQGFLFNEKLWRILRSNKRQSVAKPIPTGRPRVNGMLGLKSPVDINHYSFKVMSEKEVKEIPVWEIKTLPKTSYSTDFRCIEGWSEETQYAGLRFSDFLQHYSLGKKEDGKFYEYVGLETPDGKYYVSIDMESMLHDQTVLAYEMNQAPLDIPNGAPIRLIIPIKYGIKSLKRIGRIYFSDTRPKDYWAERGYDWYSGL